MIKRSFDKRIISIFMVLIIFFYLVSIAGNADSMDANYITGEENGSIFSLPSTAVKGQLSVTLKGNTLSNIGNITDITEQPVIDAIPRRQLFGTTAKTIMVNGYMPTSLGVSTAIQKLIVGRTYFIRFRITDSMTTMALGVGLCTNDTEKRATTFVSHASEFTTQGFSGTGSFGYKVTITVVNPKIYFFTADSGADTTAAITELAIYDVTGTTETNSELLNSHNFITADSTKSTFEDGGRVLVVGKNFLSSTASDWEQGTINSSTGADTASTVRLRNKKYARVPPSTAIIVSIYEAAYNQASYWEYDINKVFVKYTISSTGITTQSNTAYVRIIVARDDSGNITVANDFALAQPQLEIGSTKTAYEAYTDTQVYIPPKSGGYKSVGSVKDEVNVSTGTKIQKNSGDVSLSDTDYTSLDKASYFAVDIINTAAFGLAKPGTSAVDGFTRYWNSAGVELTEIAAADIGASAIGKYCYTSNNTLQIFVAPDTYADIAAARVGLGTMSLTYQLATPQTSYINPQPLICHEGGSVIVEPALRTTAVYDTGIAIENTSVPINTIESVYKIDNGVKTQVDSSKITISPDKLSFTIQGAINGETYQYVYLYDESLTTLPTIKYTVPVNPTGQINDDTDMIKSLTDTIDDMKEEIKILKSQAPAGSNAGPFQISCTENENFSMVLTAANSKDFSNRTFTVIYNSNELDVVDLCAQTTELETGPCNVNGTNIVITEVNPGIIEFIIYNPIDQSSTYSGAVNTIIFRPKITGQATVTYMVE